MKEHIFKKLPIDYIYGITSGSIKKMYHKEALLYDGSYSIGFTLLSIDPKNGSPSTSIGPIMGLKSNSLSRILNSMEAKNLIKRKPNPNDGRGILICLTELGLKKRKITQSKVSEFNETIKNLISESDLDIFYEVSYSIYKMINETIMFSSNNKK